MIELNIISQEFLVWIIQSIVIDFKIRARTDCVGTNHVKKKLEPAWALPPRRACEKGTESFFPGVQVAGLIQVCQRAQLADSQIASV